MTFDSKKIRVVAAIEFGKSHSGYAYAFKDDKEIIIRYEWDNQPFSYIKTLTQSLYNSDRKLEAWGYTALSKLAKLRQTKNAQDYSFFSNFGMALWESRKRTDQGPILTANNGQEFPVIKLVADYLRELSGLLRKEIDMIPAGQLKDEQILWCLTIPAIWKDEEKYFMRRAAIQAGLVTASEDDQERLLLVLAPEAAAIYCQEKDQQQIEVGTRFMVVDCGRNTVDITVHEMLSSGLDQIVEGIGGAYGSTYVDKEFREYLVGKLTSQALTRYEQEDPIGWLKLMGDWEMIKCDFDPTKTKISYLSIPPRLYRILSNDYPKVLEQLADEQEYEDDEKLHLSPETLQGIFKPLLDGLVQKIKEQFAQLDDRGCDIMYLVGGFSASPVLRQRIQQEFGSRVKIVMPSAPGAAILLGAVSFGLTPQPIGPRSRRTHLTYGYRTCRPFDENRDRHQKSHRQYFEEEERWYLCNRFYPFVLAGERVDINEVFTQSFFPATPEQKRLSIKLYASREKNPRYVDEPGVEEIGELNIDISSTVGTGDRPVEVSINFAKTEIVFSAKDIKTGKTYNTSCSYSSAYSIE